MAFHEIAAARHHHRLAVPVVRAETGPETDGKPACVPAEGPADRLQRLPSGVQHLAVFAGVRRQERRAPSAQPHMPQSHSK